MGESDRENDIGALPAQERALLQFAVSQSSAIFYIADLEGDSPVRFIGANVEQITGHKPQEFLSDANFGFKHIHPEDLPQYKRDIEDLRHRKSLTHEYRFACKDGSYRWFRDELKFMDGDGSGQFVGCMVDISAEKEAEIVARENVEMFKSILDASPIPMSMVRFSDRHILFENPAIHAVFREDAEMSPKRSGAYDVDPGERDTYYRLLEEHGAVDNFLIHFRRDDGSVFVAAHSARVIDFEGEEVVVAGIVDLTEQKEREAELELARQTLEDAIESLSEGFVLYDENDRLVMCNSQYRAFHGDSADLLVPGAYWPDVTRERGKRGLFKHAAGGFDDWLKGQLEQRGIAHREVFPSGDGRWFEYSHRPTRQGGFVSVWHDITERVAMERNLRDSEEQFRSIVEGHPLPVWMVDLESARILYESPAAAAMVGREWPSKDPAFTTDHVPDKAFRDAVNAELRRSGSVFNAECELQRKDGSRFWASINDRLISLAGREVSITSFVDLTQQREAEAEMSRQRERLHQNEKLSALGELLAGVAHELNNPISILVGQAQLLQETAEAVDTKTRADRILTAADRCARIVKTFLAMARRDPGDAAPVMIADAVNSALEVTRYSLSSSGVELKIDIAEDLPPVVADADQLVQVFTNLIVNAEHAMQDVEGERILHIAASHLPETDIVETRVSDTGHGISDEAVKRVFEPLFTTKSGGTGTGMGLALCHRILDSHGGSIEISSPPGQGATFAVRLPGASSENSQSRERKKPASQRSSYTILVVDDEPDVGETIADILISDGHEVEVVGSGTQALERLATSTFDVILSDVRMPGLDGPNLFSELQALDGEMVHRIAFITGDTLSPRVREFLDSCGRPYLEKPILPRDVRALVSRLMPPE